MSDTVSVLSPSPLEKYTKANGIRAKLKAMDRGFHPTVGIISVRGFMVSHPAGVYSVGNMMKKAGKITTVTMGSLKKGLHLRLECSNEEN